MDPDSGPEALQRKVQFDVRLYFARRGCENIDKMEKDHFKLEYDQKHEMWFVIKNKDELTKNHKEIGEIVSGIMPENKGDRLCPVRSYKMYLEKLHPENKFLWQKVLENPKKDIWYGRQHIGKNTLGKLMGLISLHCELAQMYTNHSIRVTGITVLTRMKFTPSEIMAVSGHKSVQSLANYQRTQPKQKITMGKALYQSMTRMEEDMNMQHLPPNNQLKAIENVPTASTTEPRMALALTTPQPKNIQPAEAMIPFDDGLEQEVPDFDLVDFLDQIEKENKTTNTNTTGQNVAVSTTTSQVQNIPKSMFANCNIQNITFNINK